MRTILFIASSNFSGSTLLTMLLGNTGQVSVAGEIAHLRDHARDGKLCTCGERVTECPFWRAVETELRSLSGDATLRLEEFQTTAAPDGHSVHKRVPNPNEVALITGSQLFQSAIAAFDGVAREFRTVAGNIHLLCEAITRVEGSAIVIDPSKEPSTMKSIYLHDPDRVRVIYLVRDGRAVSHSTISHDGVDFETAARRWVRKNFNYQVMLRSIPTRRRLFLRYEDLVTDPAPQFEKIEALLGTSLESKLDLDKTGYHYIAGNPMRWRKGETEVKLDERWKAKITAEEEQVFQRVAGRYNRRFGYSGGSPGES